MSSEIELKPCPFCGGEAKPFRHQAMGEDGWRPPFLYGVACSECPTVIKSRHVARTEADMAELWNRRTPPSSATPGDGFVLTMRSGVSSMNDNVIGTFCDYATALTVGGMLYEADKLDHPEYRTFDVKPQERAGSDAGAVRCGNERYELDAYIWRRESTQEWVFEISGAINGTAFISRHVEPLTTPPEDVAGLPSLYDTRPQPSSEENGHG